MRELEWWEKQIEQMSQADIEKVREILKLLCPYKVWNVEPDLRKRLPREMCPVWGVVRW